LLLTITINGDIELGSWFFHASPVTGKLMQIRELSALVTGAVKCPVQ